MLRAVRVQVPSGEREIDQARAWLQGRGMQVAAGGGRRCATVWTSSDGMRNGMRDQTLVTRSAQKQEAVSHLLTHAMQVPDVVRPGSQVIEGRLHSWCGGIDQW